MTTTYAFEPLAPLVFRSGRPFGSTGAADGASFPLPSSVAGALRTCLGDAQGGVVAPTTADNVTRNALAVRLATLEQQPVRGPLLARRARDGSETVLLPRPADAIYVVDEGVTSLHRLRPGPLPAGHGSDLPPGLLHVLPSVALRGKPGRGPEYWSLPRLLAWQSGEPVSLDQVKEDGLDELVAEQRTHVALADLSLTSDPGMLFQTAGVDLARRRNKEADGIGDGWSQDEYVLLARSEIDIVPGLITLGGERRLSRLRSSEHGWPAAPQALEAAIARSGGLRLTIATPSIFSQGHLPGWLDAQTLEGTPPGAAFRLKLRAAAIERWTPVSGWDLAAGKARASRKAVAAGAVYWFAFAEAPAALPPGWLNSLWLQPISDYEQDRLDGFGLTIPGAWQPPA